LVGLPGYISDKKIIFDVAITCPVLELPVTRTKAKEVAAEKAFKAKVRMYGATNSIFNLFPGGDCKRSRYPQNE
jgi:hypothetical protein